MEEERRKDRPIKNRLSFCHFVKYSSTAGISENALNDKEDAKK